MSPVVKETDAGINPPYSMTIADSRTPIPHNEIGMSVTRITIGCIIMTSMNEIEVSPVARKRKYTYTDISSAQAIDNASAGINCLGCCSKI